MTSLEKPSAQKWEYKKLSVPSVSELNEYGEEGWEAVATAAWVYGILYTVILKRPK